MEQERVAAARAVERRQSSMVPLGPALSAPRPMAARSETVVPFSASAPRPMAARSETVVPFSTSAPRPMAARSETFVPYSGSAASDESITPPSSPPYSPSDPTPKSSPAWVQEYLRKLQAQKAENMSSEVEVGETRTFDQLYDARLKQAAEDGTLIVIDDEPDAKRA